MKACHTASQESNADIFLLSVGFLVPIIFFAAAARLKGNVAPDFLVYFLVFLSRSGPENVLLLV